MYIKTKNHSSATILFKFLLLSFSNKFYIIFDRLLSIIISIIFQWQNLTFKDAIL